ncbi:MAG: LamG domain-containing protein [Candidatus Pacearchaeota archaeon]
MTEGETPFYTNISNPYNLTLDAGQSQVVDWYVNATGGFGSISPFSVYVNITNSTSLSSNILNWNVTIGGSSINLSLINPLTNANPNKFNKISVNVSCENLADCGNIDLVLDRTTTTQVENGGFETGDLLNWSSSNGATVSTSEYFNNTDYSLWMLNSNSVLQIVNQTFASTNPYYVCYWVKGSVSTYNGHYDTFEVYAINDRPNSPRLLESFTNTGTTWADWTRNCYNVSSYYPTVNPIKGVLFKAYDDVYYTDNNVYIDDVCLADISQTCLTPYSGGIISMTEGETPFYTNISNPYNLTLDAGQSQVVDWYVNATGGYGSISPFSVYVNITNSTSLSSNILNWNVTIGGSSINLSLINPLTNANPNKFNKISVNVSCENLADCGIVNLVLDRPTTTQVENGGFETGDFTNWTRWSATGSANATLSTSEYFNDSGYSLNMLTTPDRKWQSVSQTFASTSPDYLCLWVKGSLTTYSTYYDYFDVYVINDRPNSPRLVQRYENINWADWTRLCLNLTPYIPSPYNPVNGVLLQAYDTIYSNNPDNNIYIDDVCLADASQTCLVPYGGGIISMIEGETPFYTNISNPYNLTLDAGQSQVIDWYVNATGGYGSISPFSVYVNITNSTSLSSNILNWNVTIGGSSINLSLINPLTNANPNKFNKISVNVSCEDLADCGNIDLVLDRTTTTQVENGGFETGSLQNWSSSNGAAISTSEYFNNSGYSLNMLNSNSVLQIVNQTFASTNPYYVCYWVKGSVSTYNGHYDTFEVYAINDRPNSPRLLESFTNTGTTWADWTRNCYNVSSYYPTVNPIKGVLFKAYDDVYYTDNNVYIDDVCLADISQTCLTPYSGGIISMTEGETPFYTNISNPYNLTLDAGQSQVIDWYVNATGGYGSISPFSVYVNITNSTSLSSNILNWNVTIGGSSINLSLINPLGNVEVNPNRFFNVTVNITCENLADCGNINVTLSRPSDVQLDNYGFETGDFTNWTKWTESGSANATISSTQHFNDSSYSLNMLTTPDRKWQSVSQTFSSTSPAYLCLWVKGSLTTYSTYYDYFDVYVINDRPNSPRLVQRYENINWADWTRLCLVLTPYVPSPYNPVKGVLLQAYDTIYSSNPDNNIYIDDVCLADINQTCLIDTEGKEIILTENGTLPFYTNNPNPYSINLDSGQSQLLTWLVNATGSYGSLHTFVAYANITNNPNVSAMTNAWNVTIKIPQFNISLISPSANIGVVTNRSFRVQVNVSCDFVDCGELNVSLKGNGTELISTNTSEKPFYANNTNPYTLILNAGESQIIDWYVNATGDYVNTYTFLAFVNATSNMNISHMTNYWNITIGQCVANTDCNTGYTCKNNLCVMYPSISFVPPTLADDSFTIETSIPINLSISKGTNPINNINYNWNGTTFTMYNNSLILMYNFENNSLLEESATKVVDASIYSNNGTVNGAAGWSPSGKYGGAINFDGSSGYINASFYGSQKQGLKIFSVSLWVNTNESRTHSTYWNRPSLIGEASNGGGSGDFGITTNGGYIGMWGALDPTDRSYLSSTTQINDNQWHFITTSGNGSYINLYVDGVYEGNMLGGTVGLDRYPFYIGAVDTGDFGTLGQALYFHSGLIDEVRIWNRTLSAQEIYQQYVSNLQKYNQTNWYLYVNQSNTSTAGLGNGVYTYYANVNDTADNSDLTETRTVVLNTFYWRLNLNGVNGDIHINKDELVTAYINLSSPPAGNLSIYKDGVIAGQAQDAQGLTFSSSDYPIDRYYNITAKFNETSDYDASYITHWVIVGPDTTNPNVTLFSPGNNSLINSSSILFIFNASDNYLENLNCSIYINGNLTGTNSSVLLNTNTTFNITGLTEGENQTWMINCIDNSSNSGNASRIFSISDLTNPTANITYPSNETILYEFTPTITVNLSDNQAPTLSYVIFVNGEVNKIGSGVPSGVLTNITLETLSVGTYEIIVRAEDLAGNKKNSTAVTISLANVPIQLISPENNYTTNQSNINFTFNFSDDSYSLASCSLYINETLIYTNETTLTNENNTFNTTAPPQGNNLVWKVNCTTLAYTRENTRIINIDYSAPFFINDSVVPESFSGYSVTGNLFNITVEDNVAVDSVILENNFNGSFVNETLNCSGTSAKKNCSVLYHLASGTYSYQYIINDSYGNMNRSELKSYEVTAGVDVVSLYLNGIENNLTITYSHNVNAAADSFSGTHSLFRDGTLVTNPEITNLSVGYYKYSANSTGDIIYAPGEEVTYYLNVTKAIPLLNLTANPGWNNEYGVEITVNCTSNNPEIIPKIYINGIENANPFISIPAIGDYNYSCNISESTNFTTASVNNTMIIRESSDVLTLYLNGIENNLTIGYGNITNATANSTSGTHSLFRDGTLVTNPEITILPAGYYNYSVNSTGNMVYTPGEDVSYYLNVTKAIPEVILSANPGWKIKQDTNATISCFVNNTETNISLYLDGSIVNSSIGGMITNYNNFSFGNYSYFCNSSETQNYSSTFSNNTLVAGLLQETNLTLNIIPSQDVADGTETTVNCTANHLEAVPALYLDGQIQVNPYIVTHSVGTYHYVCNISESSNYSSAEVSANLSVRYLSHCNLTFNPLEGVYGENTIASCSCSNPETSAQLWRNNVNVTNEIGQNKILGAGNYTYICNSSMTLNYLSASNSSNYTVIKATPILNLTLNGSSESNITLLSGNSTNITSVLISPNSGQIRLYQNNVQIWLDNSPLSLSRTFNIPGIYEIKAEYRGNANYSAVNKTFYAEVIDSGLPFVSLILPLNNSWNKTNNLAFKFNVTDYSSVLNCSLYLNNVLNMTNETTRTNISTTFNVSGLVEGKDQNWTVDCIDNATNHGNSSRVFNIDLTNPEANITSGDLITSNPSPIITVNLSDNLAPTLSYIIYVNDVINKQGSGILNGVLTNITLNQLSSEENKVIVQAIDLAGNKVNSSLVDVNLSGTIVFLSSPGVDYVSNVSDVNFTFNYTSISSILNCSLYLNNSLNQTNESSPQGLPITFSVFNISDKKNITWEISCIDNNEPTINASSSRSLTVDTIPPYWTNITLSKPSGSEYSSVPLQFNISFFDNIEMDSVIIENNFTGNFTNNTMTCVGTEQKNCTYSSIVLVGNYSYRFIGNDTAGWINITPYFNYSIIQRQVSFTLLLDGNNSDLMVNISHNVEIASKVKIPDHGTSYIYDNGVSIGVCEEAAECYFYKSYNTVGYHNISAIFYSTYLYNSIESSHIITVTDPLSPSISIVYPTNKTYTSDVTALNYTSNGVSCWYSLDNGILNSSVVDCGINWTGLISNEGNNTWTVYAMDIFGNERNATVMFTKDSSMMSFNVTINSTDGSNQTKQDLNCFTTILDSIPGHQLNVSVIWYKNNATSISIDYNNSYENGTEFISTLGNLNTTKGENWSCAMRYFNGYSYSEWVNSSELVILNTLPNVTLISPVENNLTTNRTPLFSWNGSDDDEDILTYEFNLTLVPSSLCTDSFERSQNKETLLSNTSYIATPYLRCLYDNGDFYNWKVRAYDGETYSNWTNLRNVSIQSLVSISLPVDSINFGVLGLSEKANTSSGEYPPMILQNNGNVESNITANFTDLWEGASNPSENYQFKITNTTSNCFNPLNTITSFTNATAPGITGNIIQKLNFTSGYQTGCNNVSVDILVRVPSSEPAGNKSSMITFTSHLGENYGAL